MRKPRFDFNDAVQHPGRHVTFDVSTSLVDEEDLDLVEPVTGTLDGVSTGTMLLITGELRAVAVMECSRCLSPVRAELNFKVNEEFPITGVPSGYGNREHAQVEADEPYPIFDGNSLLYEDFIRQVLWLQLPVQPLCRPDCDGIPREGGDGEKARPEFQILSDLIDKPGDKS